MRLGDTCLMVAVEKGFIGAADDGSQMFSVELAIMRCTLADRNTNDFFGVIAGGSLVGDRTPDLGVDVAVIE